MSIYHWSPQIEKRIYTNANHNYAITNYGIDNLYPQLMNELHKRSPLTKQAIRVLSDFCVGEGWSGNGEKVVNRFGQTFNDLLRLASNDLNLFEGFSQHYNFTGIGRIDEIQYVPFDYARLGIKDEKTGATNKVFISNNWEQDSQKYNNYSGLNPVEYNIFNPKLAAIDAMNNGNGQIMYWTPLMNQYPLSSLDAIRDAVQTDAEIMKYSKNSIQNGFLGVTIFKMPGGFDSQDDKRETIKKVKTFTGAENGNSTMVAETPEDWDGNLIESIPAPNNDTLFNLTGEKVVNTILQNFGVPGPLLAVNPQGAVFSQEQIRDSYMLMNLRTAPKRKILQRAFEPVAKLFGVRLGEIKEIPWEIPGMNDPKLNGDPDQLNKEEPKEKEEIKEEEDKQEAKLYKLYG